LIDVNAEAQKNLNRATQGLTEFLQRFFVPLVPHPQALFLCLHQAGFGQDCHVMGDGRLRKFDPLLSRDL
jgi:hypothetical protein